MQPPPLGWPVVVSQWNTCKESQEEANPVVKLSSLFFANLLLASDNVLATIMNVNCVSWLAHIVFIIPCDKEKRWSYEDKSTVLCKLH